ncbi:MAG: ATP-binding protein [Actinomycetota bacterium]|nr:ATP-binding protein [Actinomycetota bacterium]
MAPAAEIDIRLQPDVKAPERARRSLDRMEGEVAREVLENVRLLVNELVTNSVKFAPQGAIELRLVASDGSVRVEVHDKGPGFAPTHETPGLHDTSGRGLFLVDVIADRWGVRLDGTTCVWFEIDTHARRPSRRLG